MGKGRGLLSTFPRELWKMMHHTTTTNFLLKHKVQQSLLTLVAVADDAEAKLSASGKVVEWMCHFHDALFRLEELLTEISLGVTSDSDAEPQVDFILRRFEILTKQKHLLFQTEEEEHRSSRNPPVYGRDKEMNEMVELLLSELVSGGKTSVLAVVGVDGIGKTTLADIVYNDDRVKAFFNLRVWVELQQELDAEGLAKIILDVLNQHFRYDESLTELMVRLHRCLQGKKLLLVLDGFRNVTGWETLRTCFGDAAGQGSVVIITTQKVEVAMKMGSNRVLHLGLLSPEDSNYLFLEHAFGYQNEYPPLVSVAKRIVRKIGGLPLAIKKLGSLLYDCQDIHIWEKLERLKRSELLELDLDVLPQFPASLFRYHFGNLVRLEVIGARKSNLPDEIGRLKCLEYFDLSFSCILTLPDSISALSRLQTLILSFCRYLRKLPSTLVDLVNLSYLDFRGSHRLLEMPFQLGRLVNLKTLIGFIVNTNNGSNLIELASISSVQTLSITELQNMVDATCASETNLKDKRFLENLTLGWNQLCVLECEQTPNYLEPSVQPKMLDILGIAGCEQALEFFEPPRQLKMLEIIGSPIRSLPHWLGDASYKTLEVLHLRDCKNCFFLPPLGQLSSLKELSIQGFDNVRSVGNEFYGETTSRVPFKSLQTLWFVDMPKWKEWFLLDSESLQFPSLRVLYLISCPELLMDLPKHFHYVEKIKVSECDRLVASLPKIPDKYEPMVQEQDSNETLEARVAEMTPESSSQQASLPKIPDRFEPMVQEQDSNETLEARVTFMTLESSSQQASTSKERETIIESFESAKITGAWPQFNLSSGVKSLTLEGLEFLECLPNDFLKDIEILELFFIDCPSLKHFADVLSPSSLRTLYIHKCPNMEFLISLGTHKKFALLEYLCIISSCISLTSISINLFPRLRNLYIKDCPNLKSFSMADGLHDQNMKLESLVIRDCPSLISFPDRGLSSPNLKSISISNCRSLKSLPNHLGTLGSLQSLVIVKCPELESFPDGGLPSNLSLLSIVLSDQLAPQKEWKLHTLHSLTHLEIEGGCIGMKSFPNKGLLPRNLKSLRISRLSSLRVLNGSGLQDLTALEELEIACCGGLYSLPEEGLPSSLISLCIKECKILTQKLLYKAGTEWNMVAHIPSLQIDDVEVHGVEERRGRAREGLWTKIIKD